MKGVDCTRNIDMRVFVKGVVSFVYGAPCSFVYTCNSVATVLCAQTVPLCSFFEIIKALIRDPVFS